MAFGGEPIQLARMNPYVAGCIAATAETCSATLKSKLPETLDQVLQVGKADTDYYRGVTFRLTTAGKICSVLFKLSNTGDISAKSYTAHLWSTTGAATTLDAVLATSDAVTCPTCTTNSVWNKTEVTFTFPTPYSASTGVDYVITLTSGAATDATKYIEINYNGSDAESYWGWGRWSSAGGAAGSSGAQDIYGTVKGMQ